MDEGHCFLSPLRHETTPTRRDAVTNGQKPRRGVFTNVVTSGPSGRVELVVPGVGPALVRQAVERFAKWLPRAPAPMRRDEAWPTGT
jgi:hypothetical protein